MRVSNPSVGLRESGAEIPWKLVPETKIGALQGDPETVFSSYVRVPFTAEHVYLLDGEGGIWFGRGDQFRLYHAALAGDTLREITLQADPTPVTRRELDEPGEREGVGPPSVPE